MIRLPRVAVYGSLTAQPAHLRGISYLFGSFRVPAGVEFALGLVAFRVLFPLML